MEHNLPSQTPYDVVKGYVETVVSNTENNCSLINELTKLPWYRFNKRRKLLGKLQTTIHSQLEVVTRLQTNIVLIDIPSGILEVNQSITQEQKDKIVKEFLLNQVVQSVYVSSEQKEQKEEYLVLVVHQMYSKDIGSEEIVDRDIICAHLVSTDGTVLQEIADTLSRLTELQLKYTTLTTTSVEDNWYVDTCVSIVSKEITNLFE